MFRLEARGGERLLRFLIPVARAGPAARLRTGLRALSKKASELRCETFGFAWTAAP